MMDSDFASRDLVLSVVVIAKDESDRIPKLLASVQSLADEIIVVDSGSSDGTVEICKSYGARVIHHKWMGYRAQKQYALEQARGEWILNLDADEALAEETCAEIRQAITTASSDVAGFSQPRLSRYLNRWIRYGGWYPDRKIRLVRRGRGVWVGKGLHERLEVSGLVKPLRYPILHYVYRNISDQIQTVNNFSSVAAQYQPSPRGGWYVLWGVVRAIGKFLECTVWKLGFLDGIAGIIIAMNSAFYVFLKHAKTWERGLERTTSSRESDFLS